MGLKSDEAAEATDRFNDNTPEGSNDSRLYTIFNLFGVYLLVVSDPLLSSLDLQICYHLYVSRHGKLQPNTLALLAEPRLSVAEIGKKGDTAFGKNS